MFQISKTNKSKARRGFRSPRRALLCYCSSGSHSTCTPRAISSRARRKSPSWSSPFTQAAYAAAVMFSDEPQVSRREEVYLQISEMQSEAALRSYNQARSARSPCNAHEPVKAFSRSKNTLHTVLILLDASTILYYHKAKELDSETIPAHPCAMHGGGL